MKKPCGSVTRLGRGVWSEKMLMALERGIKGGVWFSLIDSRAERDSQRSFIQKGAGSLSRCARLKHAGASSLVDMDRWIRVRLRSILRKCAGRRGKGRGLDHHRWPNSYFVSIGLFNLEAAQKQELMRLRKAANF